MLKKKKNPSSSSML